MTEQRNLALPGNLRYQPESLKSIFGYDHLFVAVCDVELATLQVLGDIGIIPPEAMAGLTGDIVSQLYAITTTEVDGIERTVTKHDIRAWVRIAQAILPQPLRRWVHVPLTSYDALDTARALQFARAHAVVIRPSVQSVVRTFAELVRKFAGQVQIGRTHGQHALPITVGFWFATILNRILTNARMIDIHASQLFGKISGAVGAHNAQIGLGIAERCGHIPFETRVLAKLGLKPAPISTQILPPESLAYFLFSCALLSASLAQFGRDARHLMRSEIGEVAESFEEGQVGSSTMAHKRNPITFENLEGMWLRTKSELGKVLDTLISDHQRDLVGSSIARDYPIIVVNLTQQLDALLREDRQGKSFLSRISVDADACRRNLRRSAHLILAEPIYIALQMAGYEGDAHELVNRRAMPVAERTGSPLITIIQTMADGDRAIRESLEKIPAGLLNLLASPEAYVGDAKAKALEVATAADHFLSQK